MFQNSFCTKVAVQHRALVADCAGQEASLAEWQAPSHLGPQSEADRKQRGEQEGAGGEGAGATTDDRGAEASNAL